MTTFGGGREAHLLIAQSAAEDAPVRAGDAQICAASPYGMPPSLSVRLTVADLDLMIEDLSRAAGRLESMARRAKFGRKHDVAAARMRALRVKIMRRKVGKDA